MGWKRQQAENFIAKLLTSQRTWHLTGHMGLNCSAQLSDSGTWFWDSSHLATRSKSTFVPSVCLLQMAYPEHSSLSGPLVKCMWLLLLGCMPQDHRFTGCHVHTTFSKPLPLPSLSLLSLYVSLTLWSLNTCSSLFFWNTSDISETPNTFVTLIKLP